MQPPIERPRSVTVFGILNIVCAGLGLIGIFGTIAMLSTSAASDNPVMRPIRDHPTYMAWMKISIPLGLVMLAALLAAGIGLLRLKPWARVLSVVYAVAAIVTGLFGIVFNYLFLVRPMLEEAVRKQGAEAPAAIGAAVGGLLGSCFGMVYPILLLIFMTRPKVINAFRPAVSEPPALPPL